MKRINLLLAGHKHVSLVYNRTKRLFIAYSFDRLYAISDDPKHKIVWKQQDIFTMSTLGFDPEKGWFYFVNSSYLCVYDTSGKRDSFLSLTRGLSGKDYSMTLDLAGSGTILLGSDDVYVILNREGKVIGMKWFRERSQNVSKYSRERHPQFFLCTPTASIDPNSSCDQYMRLRAARLMSTWTVSKSDQ